MVLQNNYINFKLNKKMKKKLANFRGRFLNLNELKEIKGGDMYCDCGGGRGPVSSGGGDCITVCTGWSSWGNGMTGSSGGNVVPSAPNVNPDFVPCTQNVYNGDGSLISVYPC
jgi:hypothetical protein